MRLSLFWILFCSSTVLAYSAGCSYTATGTVTAGANPRSVVAADLNQDGILDLVATNLDGDSISIFLGTGKGLFSTATNYSVGSKPYQVVIADFNSDGWPDIATANFGGQDVSVLLGKGDGSFQSAVTYLTGSAPRALVASDMNGDGQIDLAVANSVAATISVRIGTANGTFPSKVDTTAGSNPHGIAAADFNGDGFMDLVIANAVPTGSITVLLGKGDGSLRVGSSFSVGSRPYSIAVADFNGDGSPDIATANFGASNLSVLLGKGNGDFQTSVPYSTPGAPVAIRIADVNLDGIPDLLAADFGTNSLDILLGSDDGSFGSVTSLSGLAGTYDVAIGDFDSDGTPDLAVATSGTNTLTVLHGSCGTSSLVPVIRSGGVVNAASGASGISPGTWTTIYGTNLAAETYTMQVSDEVNGYFPTSLKGVSVQMDGKPAYIYFVSPSQINVLTPDDSNSGTVSVSVTKAGVSSATFSTILQSIQPGLFTVSGYATSRVVKTGDTFELYGSGFGPTVNPMTATVGGISAPVVFCGLIGPGLYQINLAVPNRLTSGTYPVVVSIGGVATQTSALVKIQNN